MKILSARYVVESIGIIGVVGSLIFVGGEIRQNAIATRASMNADVAVAFMDINLMIASSPELAQLLADYADDPAAAPRNARIQMLSVWRALFHIWSNVHRQQLNGTIDPAIYESLLQEISTYASVATEKSENLDVVRRRAFIIWAWESERLIYNPDFQEFIDEFLNTRRPEPTS